MVAWTDQENPQITPSYGEHLWSLRDLSSHYQLLNDLPLIHASSSWNCLGDSLLVNMIHFLMALTLSSLSLHLSWVSSCVEVGSLLFQSNFQLWHLLRMPDQCHCPCPMQASRSAQPQAMDGFTVDTVADEPASPPSSPITSTLLCAIWHQEKSEGG